MARKLDGKKVAILVADGFEQVEMTGPRDALDEAGAETKIVLAEVRRNPRHASYR